MVTNLDMLRANSSSHTRSFPLTLGVLVRIWVGGLVVIPRRRDNEESRPPRSSLPEKTGIGVKIDMEDSNGEPDMWHSGVHGMFSLAFYRRTPGEV